MGMANKKWTWEMTNDELRRAIAQEHGWTRVHEAHAPTNELLGHPPGATPDSSPQPVPNWPEDWAAAGPLLENEGMIVGPRYGTDQWRSTMFHGSIGTCFGPTPQRAIAETWLEWKQSKT